MYFHIFLNLLFHKKHIYHLHKFLHSYFICLDIIQEEHLNFKSHIYKLILRALFKDLKPILKTLSLKILFKFMLICFKFWNKLMQIKPFFMVRFNYFYDSTFHFISQLSLFCISFFSFLWLNFPFLLFMFLFFIWKLNPFLW